MTMATKKEIFDEHKTRYWRSAKREKGEILNHLCAITGLHRKAAVRKLSALQRRDPLRFDQRGRKAYYTPDVTAALKDVWETGDQACGEDLHPMIAEYVAGMRALGEWGYRDETTRKLLAMSERTVKRRVAKFLRTRGLRKGLSTTKPSDIRYVIPVFKGPWNDLLPGHGQLDTVAHCGASVAGDYAFTVNYIDAATYWVIPRAQWNKGQEATLESVKGVKKKLPVPWLEGHPDSGGEFINWAAKAWFDQEHIRLSRSEPNRKNDNMYVEERNGHVVRRYLGWQRLDNRAVVPVMNELYDALALYLNHFKAVRRTVSKDKVGSRYVRRFEKKAKTPYQRMLEHPAVTEAVKEKLRQEHAGLNPLILKRQIDTLITQIFRTQRSKTRPR
jgi:hypothetical protein